jgi:hypothetical protein
VSATFPFYRSGRLAATTCIKNRDFPSLNGCSFLKFAAMQQYGGTPLKRSSRGAINSTPLPASEIQIEALPEAASPVSGSP